MDTGTDKARYDKSLYLPTSKEEIERLGWDRPDIILFSGDAYVDHPSFGAAVIGRVLQSHGYKVAIVPQPNWRDDLRDFKKLGKPKLFFGVSPGAMDSMVNHYTAARRLRHDDPYTPGGKHGARPDYPSIVYSKILKELYPDVPVIGGGIECSLRRVSHYDYWQDKLRPSILIDSRLDMLIYGMGERTIVALADRLSKGENIKDITDLPQTAFISSYTPDPDKDIILHSYEECVNNRTLQASNFKFVEIESNKMEGNRLWQQTGKRWICINPMLPQMTSEEIDASFDLPYTRYPHPRYKGKVIPAYDMIRHSINMHRGCFGGCAFCTISAHQGKFIASRSKESILREAIQVTKMDDFKGYISDLGGPSANMYKMKGRDISKCRVCTRPSCLHPVVCPNLNNDHSPLLEVYKAVDNLPGVKKSFVGSGVRYDLAMAHSDNQKINESNRKYLRELIANHVSGRLKVAPEHTSDEVLNIMRKPSFELFKKFKSVFDKVNREEDLKQQLIPYFISSHPGCQEVDMAELAVATKDLNFHLEQVQDFTPTPMTVSTEIYYSGVHPYTLKKVFTAKSDKEKQAQRQFFFWYKPDAKYGIAKALQALHRPDLLKALYPGGIPGYNTHKSYNTATTSNHSNSRHSGNSKHKTKRTEKSGRFSYGESQVSNNKVSRKK
ncbi:MAG: YgiQ family radical SAM protein [Muribaculaceae bacterium]|nr:YgiQ family radical SAM protein [Muribaculaceae bacterium]